MGHILTQGGVTPIVVGGQSFFDPLEPVALRRMRKTRRIIQVEAHPTINHEPKIGADPLARESHAQAYRDDVVELIHAFPEIDVRLWPNFAHLAEPDAATRA